MRRRFSAVFRFNIVKSIKTRAIVAVLSQEFKKVQELKTDFSEKKTIENISKSHQDNHGHAIL